MNYTNGLISIIIPCRNEENFIGKCLETILKQDYPKENLEVLVVDGMSQDKTHKIVEQYAANHKSLTIRLLDNPKKYTPFSLNIGIKESKGELIMVMGAHAGYERDYVSRCVKHLRESGADNVGGALKTMPSQNTLVAEAVALALSSFFGAASSFRTGSKEPKEVDTVFGGCYKREVFDKIGYFNENLIRSQDFDLNMRLKKAGGKIMLFPDIVAYYYPSSDFSHFVKHNFQDGVWVTYPLKFGLKAFSLRHLVPLLFVVAILITFALSYFSFWSQFLFVIIFGTYMLLNLFFSFIIALKNGPKYFLVLPTIFIYRHIPYGLGSLWGFIKMLKP